MPFLSISRSFLLVLIAILSVIFILPQVESKPQLEHGSPLAPGGRFPFTVNMAIPPRDPKLPPIVRPEIVPIHEDNGEMPPAK
ncbi:uncharacterized protein LOC131804038 [Musca domestica]|uniref:Uncharacterized protein LOC131804038 n=1 Tax=Musca domestica TaxID=7370 RepID=A0ABM3V918_MUSDO|nr:uncharacterized protein LOC131804038 [Musca domestica]